MPTRRAFLATGAVGVAAAVGGCMVLPHARLTATPLETDADIGRRASTAPETTTSYTLDIPGGTRTSYVDREYRDLVDDAADGSTEVLAGEPLYQPSRPVRRRGVPYELRWERVGTGTRTEFELTVRIRHDPDAEPPATYNDLPQRDLMRLAEMDAVVFEPVEDEVVVRDTLHYDEAERAESALVPEPDRRAIAMDENVAELAVEARSVEVPRYRVAASALAPSLSAFGREVWTAYGFELDGLSDAERELFESAVGEGVHREREVDDTFESLADRFLERPAVFASTYAGEWLADCDGDRYWVEFDFRSLDEYAGAARQGDGPANVGGHDE